MRQIRPTLASLVRSRAANGARGDRGRGRRATTSSRSWVGIGFGLGVGLLLAYALGQALLQSAQILTLVLLALFAAVSLEPVVGALRQLRVPRTHQLRCRPDLVDVDAGARIAGGIGQHGHFRLDAELGGEIDSSPHSLRKRVQLIELRRRMGSIHEALRKANR